ncbi:MFS transporter [Nostoc commune]|uniref:MFS transporter n=1 Tax=Nostoc commune TaxID=1178 RepID=UPI002072E140|nr:MFS transporter [Nostoc commune]
MGSQMQTVAISWELYERTNSAIALGGVGLAQVLPMIILTLIAGDVADRHDAYGGLRLRKLTILLSVMLLTLCSLALGVLSYTQGAIFLIYACLVLTGVAKAFLKPASDALMWQLIPVNAFTNAAMWNSSSFSVSRSHGPSLRGIRDCAVGKCYRSLCISSDRNFTVFYFNVGNQRAKSHPLN